MPGRAVYRKTAKFPAWEIGMGTAISLTGTISFHGHAFGEIARFIDISAEFDCKMISEKLKRHDSQDGHYVLGRFW
jgi:hypothetical protein